LKLDLIFKIEIKILILLNNGPKSTLIYFLEPEFEVLHKSHNKPNTSLKDLIRNRTVPKHNDRCASLQPSHSILCKSVVSYWEHLEKYIVDLGTYWKCIKNVVSPHWELHVNTWLTTLCTFGEKTLGTSKCRISSKPPFHPKRKKKLGLHGACCIPSLLEQKQIS
jgi:hypothetical protein